MSYRFDLQEIYGLPDDLGYHYAYVSRLERTLAAVRALVPPGSRVLDVAAGQGNFTLKLAEEGYRLTWNDLRDELVGYVELKRGGGEVTYVPGDVFSLPLSDFDLVLLCEVVEHVAHPDELLQRVAQFVRPGGYVVMTTPNGAYFRNRLPRFSDCVDPAQFESIQFQPDADGHIFLLHTHEVRGLGRLAGLDLVKLELFSNPLTSGHIKTGYLLPLLPKSFVMALERATGLLPRKIQNRIHSALLAVYRRPGSTAVTVD